MAEVTAAADELREADRRRAAELRERLIGLEDEMLRTGERARLTASVVQLHWEAGAGPALGGVLDEAAPASRARPDGRPGPARRTTTPRWSAAPTRCARWSGGAGTSSVAADAPIAAAA